LNTRPVDVLPLASPEKVFLNNAKQVETQGTQLGILHADPNIYNVLKNGGDLECDFEDCKVGAGRVELELEEQALWPTLNDEGG
jgi:hypothetical protein